MSLDGKQTWLEACFEVVTNIVVGLALSIIGNYLYLGWYNIKVDASLLTGLAIFMTALSFVRALILRRVFEHIRAHRWIPHVVNYFRR